MADSTKSPGTMASDSSNGGDVAWTSVDNAKVSDNAYANCTSVDTETTEYLKATNFSFAIPGGNNIDGIELIIERQSALGDAGDSVDDLGVARRAGAARAGALPRLAVLARAHARDRLVPALRADRQTASRDRLVGRPANVTLSGRPRHAPGSLDSRPSLISLGMTACSLAGSAGNDVS